jgi:twitching motility protein PilT
VAVSRTCGEDAPLSASFNIPDDEASFKAVTPNSQPQQQPQPQPPQQPSAPLPAPVPGMRAVPMPMRPAAQAPANGAQPAAPAPAAGNGASAQQSSKGRVQRLVAKDNPAQADAAAAASNSSPRHQVESWLAVMAKSNASDLILRAGGRPSLRIDGKISFLPGRVPGPGPLLEVLEGVMGRRRMEEWRKTGSADSAIHLDGLGRFRLNAYKQMGEPAVVIRRIGENPPSLEQLELPTTELRDLAMRKRGLILVTGIAGSGKSTTLAGMIQYMNENVERHVVTLEDPIELIFREKNCIISQREIGTDTTSFRDGLRHALRQSPDAILIGEVRDAETVVAALEATETGHLVLSTMHTVNAAQTVDRILGFFPAERHAQIRQRMASNLAGVLSQRLIPRKSGGGLVPAFELMIPTPHTRELIEEGNTTEMARVIEAGAESGLISYNECLRQLVEAQRVDLNDALSASDRPDELLLALRGIRASADRVQSPTEAGAAPPASGDPARGPDSLRLSRRGGNRGFGPTS